MARLDRQASRDKYEKPDKMEPALAAEPTENTEATEPAEPIDKIDPADPMDRIEPVEPIDRIDPLDPMLSSDPADPADPADSAELDGSAELAELDGSAELADDELRLVRMITFSQRASVHVRRHQPARHRPSGARLEHPRPHPRRPGRLARGPRLRPVW
jgi:hypothetical protein